MKSMNVDDIRESYLAFFEKKGHKRLPSDSLVPANDPTLLFTGAGMNQFKDYFLGIKKDFKRATTSQKCLRAGDLDEVGKTAFHHSFFEMLGNFSFGDYFKKEAIQWAWEYLTEVLSIPKERLRISVHKTDEEAFKIWRDTIKIREDWIYKLGDKGNFWPSNAPADGPNGPCGPCSEIYYDQNPNAKSESIESDRFAEIWNLVFTQYDRQGVNQLVELKQKNIDTGMGLERLACVLQKKSTNYEIDIIAPINHEIEKLLKAKATDVNRYNLYAISDHARASIFSIADGVSPSNEGRGYVIRKIIRRALWHAHQIVPEKRIEKPFLYKLLPVLGALMGKTYPEIKEAAESIATTLKGEEERFLDTLETGLAILEKRIQELQSGKKKTLPGQVVFELYDTYGFPDELTRTIAESRGFSTEQEIFDKLMAEQRKRAKDASQISASIFVTSDLEKAMAGLPKTVFLGYDKMQSKGKVIYTDIKNGEGIVVLDQTPFYAESGGQVGDSGVIRNDKFEAVVLDTQKKDERSLHKIAVTKGSLKVEDTVTASVDQNRRNRIMRNHTATHLLHAALRQILGNQVRQLGSLVSPDKLRFDYSYSQPLSLEKVKEIEDSVNEQILKNVECTKEEKSLDQAKQEGAVAFFGEKYGSKVRVVSVPGYSKELCGGTHCHATGQIGLFVITSDSSIASGTRRIEALTGEGAIEYVRQLRNQMAQLAQNLKTTPDQLAQRVAKLQEGYKKLEKEHEKGASKQVDLKLLVDHAKKIDGINAVLHREEGMSIQALRQLSDKFRNATTKTVFFLGSENEDKLHFIIGLSHDLKNSKYNALDLMFDLSPIIGGSGGGREDLVQGGAPNQGQFKSKWDLIEATTASYLKKVQ